MAHGEPTDDQLAIARAFVSARRQSIGFADYPGTIPATLDDAYAIQDAAIAFDGRRVVGWKVGRVNPAQGFIDRLAGPIFDGTVHDRDGTAMPVIAEGFAAAEAEYLLRIGTAPDPAKTTYTNDEARALIDAVHVGIEIASSPFVGINTHGATVTISDFGNNNGLLVGAEATGWRENDINDWPVETWIKGERIGAATSATMLDGPFGAARFLFEHTAKRGIALEPGQWISSGAVTGVHPVAVGNHVEARFGDELAVTCMIRAQ